MKPKQDKRILFVLFAALVMQIFFLIADYDIWWDASIYLGMGRYVFSLGQIGMWEPIRPLVWPILLGFFWKLGLNEIFFGKLITIFFSLGSAYLSCLIGRQLKNEEAGLISAILLSATSVFFFFSYRLYTEIPAVFFSLLAVWLFLKNHHLASGVFAALAFLTKFPCGILIAVFAMLSLRRFKTLALLLGSFAALTLPYLIFNVVMYGNPFLPIFQGDEIVKHAGSWLFSGPWYYYGIGLLKQNVLYIFAALGFMILMRKRRFLLPLLAALFMLYFSFHVHKEIRFAIIFLPYLAILAGIGISAVLKKKWVPWAIAAICLLIFFTHIPSEAMPSAAARGYFGFLEGKTEVKGEILSMHPKVSIYSPKAVIPMYYMVFDASLAQKWIDYIKEKKQNIGYVFIDTCEGGMLCPPADSQCEAKKQELLLLLEQSMKRAYYASTGRCEYYVFAQ